MDKCEGGNNILVKLDGVKSAMCECGHAGGGCAAALVRSARYPVGTMGTSEWLIEGAKIHHRDQPLEKWARHKTTLDNGWLDRAR